MKKYLVETVVMYRMRYLIEAEELGHAFDEVVSSDELIEFSQKYLDETIISGRKITDQEIDTMLVDAENSQDSRDTCSYWMGTDYLTNKVNYS
jgi:hypothetical protein